MTVQMTVRISDDAAAMVEAAVAAGEGSRADVINRALRREQRRRLAQADAAIYAAESGDDPESDAYAAWADSNATSVLSGLD